MEEGNGVGMSPNDSFQRSIERVAKDGALLISDDTGDCRWRVAYEEAVNTCATQDESGHRLVRISSCLSITVQNRPEYSRRSGHMMPLKNKQRRSDLGHQ